MRKDQNKEYFAYILMDKTKRTQEVCIKFKQFLILWLIIE
jgi:hypothetical protein